MFGCDRDRIRVREWILPTTVVHFGLQLIVPLDIPFPFYVPSQLLDKKIAHPVCQWNADLGNSFGRTLLIPEVIMVLFA